MLRLVGLWKALLNCLFQYKQMSLGECGFSIWAQLSGVPFLPNISFLILHFLINSFYQNLHFDKIFCHTFLVVLGKKFWVEHIVYHYSWWNSLFILKDTQYIKYHSITHTHTHTIFFFFFRASQVALVVKNLPANARGIRDET